MTTRTRDFVVVHSATLIEPWRLVDLDGDLSVDVSRGERFETLADCRTRMKLITGALALPEPVEVTAGLMYRVPMVEVGS